MNIQQSIIYVDEQDVKTEYCIRNNCIMVPSLFFKIRRDLCGFGFNK